MAKDTPNKPGDEKEAAQQTAPGGPAEQPEKPDSEKNSEVPVKGDTPDKDGKEPDAGGGNGGDYYDCEAADAVLVEDKVNCPEGAREGGLGHVTDDPGPLEREEPHFTPNGTGTVLDNAADEDGKEFYTIVTPDENVFYLIINRQRTTENVYFLNAVTEADLLSLPVASEPPESEPEPEEEPEPEPEPAKKGGAGSFLLVLLIVAAGGGAGYYFKIYRPKQTVQVRLQRFWTGRAP